MIVYRVRHVIAKTPTRPNHHEPDKILTYSFFCHELQRTESLFVRVQWDFFRTTRSNSSIDHAYHMCTCLSSSTSTVRCRGPGSFGTPSWCAFRPRNKYETYERIARINVIGGRFSETSLGWVLLYVATLSLKKVLHNVRRSMLFCSKLFEGILTA